jgi:glycosyltransferase XagB
MKKQILFFISFFMLGFFFALTGLIFHDMGIITVRNGIMLVVSVMSLLLTIQGLLTIWYMIFAWENAEEIDRNISPTTYIDPVYSFTAIIPARHEADVIGHTIRSVASIDYPDDKKETLIVTRYDDKETIKEAEAAIKESGKTNVRLILFYDDIINKPHALNTGLAHASNDVVVVFDAEDEPHQDIYHIVNTVMSRDQADVVQSGVQLMNFRSHWFAALNVLEYFFWFKSSLHFFAKKGFVPLGGNTVFIKRRWLDGIDGWDESCLTEDADIGIRLSSVHANIRVIYDPQHTTKEETPHNTTSFIRQRTRWNQGFLQVLWKGDWARLPKLSQKLFALYVLSWPVAQAMLFFYVPFSIYMVLQLRLPVGFALIASLPFYIVLTQLVIYMVGLFEFTRDYNLRFPLMGPMMIVVTFIPFQILLGISTFRAVGRLLLNNVSWEKTIHINAHRETLAIEEVHIPYLGLAG